MAKQIRASSRVSTVDNLKREIVAAYKEQTPAAEARPPYGSTTTAEFKPG
jgi:hypothetical protein